MGLHKEMFTGSDVKKLRALSVGESTTVQGITIVKMASDGLCRDCCFFGNSHYCDEYIKKRDRTYNSFGCGMNKFKLATDVLANE